MVYLSPLPCAVLGYLDTIPGRNLRHPPRVRLAFETQRSRPTIHRLAYLLEEALVQSSGRVG